MKTALLIGLGSFIGGTGRYLISRFVQSSIPSAFPFGTFTVNMVGCFFIGAVMGYSSKNYLEPTWQLFLTTGILGGFTTFSAFSLETMNMLRNGNIMLAMGYIGLSILIGLIGTMAGYFVTRL